MKNIHAIALNTAVDMHMALSQFTLGAVLRSDSYTEYAAGKAVNNVRTLACLSVPVALYCFSGINDIDLFSSISPLVKSNVLAAEGQTRRNLTLVNKMAELICHIQNQGYTVTEPQLANLEALVFNKLQSEDVVIISGSIPAGVDIDYLNRLITRLIERKATILLDMDPALLRRIDCKQIAIVKPNMEELSRLAGQTVVGIENIVNAAHNLIASSVVVVSLGQEGAVWIDRNKRRYIHAKSNLRNRGSADVIGCGDAMVGAFALGVAGDMTPIETLRMGISAGYANMFAEGPGIISLDHYNEAIDNVELVNTTDY